MAKWIYERWHPGWSEPDGQRYNAFTKSAYVFKLGFDGVNEPRTSFRAIAIGEVFWFNSTYWKKVEIRSSGGGSAISYIKTEPTVIPQDFLESFSAEEGSYPDNGMHEDGFWYVKVKPAFPTIRTLSNGQWIEAESGFVLKDGVWKPIEDIFVLKDGQWKNIE